VVSAPTSHLRHHVVLECGHQTATTQIKKISTMGNTTYQAFYCSDNNSSFLTFRLNPALGVFTAVSPTLPNIGDLKKGNLVSIGNIRVARHNNGLTATVPPRVCLTTLAVALAVLLLDIY